jgi:excisionase family DNA binding protein
MSEGESASGYTLREAAERLGLSARQVRRYVLDGRLPAVLVPGPRGREYRVGGSDVDQLAAERERRGSRETRRPGSRRELDTLASPAAGRIVSDHLAALERAWQRIADLERENATLRAALTAGGSTQSEAAPVPAAVPARRPPRTLRERVARLLARRRVS